MHVRSVLILGFAAIALGGCTVGYWSARAGATQEQLDQDHDVCVKDALAPADVSRPDPARVRHSHDVEIYNACMIAKGHTFHPLERAPAGSISVIGLRRP